MYRQKYLTQAEIERLIDESSDEEEIATLVRDADHVDLVVMPPDTVDELSDIEALDENIQILCDPCAFMPKEVAGQIEVVCEFNDDNKHMPARPDDDENDGDSEEEQVGKPGSSKRGRGKRPKPLPSKQAQKAKRDAFTAKWSKSAKVSFSREPVDVEKQKVEELYEKYGLCLCFPLEYYIQLWITHFVLLIRRQIYSNRTF